MNAGGNPLAGEPTAGHEVSHCYRLSGDEGVGLFEPPTIHPADFDRLDQKSVERLSGFSGLAATVSDVLDEMGWQTSVSASLLMPRHDRGRRIIGHAQTLSYLPSRRHLLYPGYEQNPPQLAHHVVFRQAVPGDVLVVEAMTETPISIMGGIAAATATEIGLAGVIVDGAIRDVDQVQASGLPVWSRAVTPRCGKGRMEAVSVNNRIRCGGVQVVPGDLVIADDTGLCFIPSQARESVLARVLEVSHAELRQSARGA